MNQDMYFDKDGKPIDLDTWCKLMGDLEYRIIAKTKLKDGQEVSTVWLGLNHAFLSGRKLIFETMVFPECDEMERYETLEEAKRGHEAMIEKISLASQTKDSVE